MHVVVLCNHTPNGSFFLGDFFFFYLGVSSSKIPKKNQDKKQYNRQVFELSDQEAPMLFTTIGRLVMVTLFPSFLLSHKVCDHGNDFHIVLPYYSPEIFGCGFQWA